MSQAEQNKALIEKFFSSFKSGDGDAMARCYHPDAVFSDPVFPRLSADEAGAMWKMFCRPDSDLQVEYGGLETTENSVSASWEARYSFPPGGRNVHNRIRSAFEFKDGKIIKHSDSFDFYKWSRMALGPVGILLGWTPIVRSKVQRQARAQLRRSMSSS